MSTICSSADVASLCIIDSGSDDDDSDDDEYFCSRNTEEIVVGEGNTDDDDDEEEDGDTSSTIIQEKEYSKKQINRKAKRRLEIYKQASKTAADEIKKLNLSEYVKHIYHDEVRLLHDLHKYCGGENGCKYILQ